LVETMVSMLVLFAVSAAAFNALQYYMRSYGSTRLRADIHMNVRSSLELMSQEIGQAGLLNFTPRVLTTAVTANQSSQTVPLSSVDSIFAGETLIIDNDTNQETITVLAVNTSASQITAVFGKNHAANETVNGIGVFPQGILSSSTGTELRLFGDINGNGTLVYIKYTCAAAPGLLSRSATVITPSAATASPPTPLVSNIVANPGGTPCFQYAPPVTVKGSTFVTSVAVTVSVRTDTVDPQTGQYVTMTRSFLNLSPRNVVSGYNLALAGYTSRLQATPTNVPLM